MFYLQERLEFAYHIPLCWRPHSMELGCDIPLYLGGTFHCTRVPHSLDFQIPNSLAGIVIFILYIAFIFQTICLYLSTSSLIIFRNLFILIALPTCRTSKHLCFSAQKKGPGVDPAKFVTDSRVVLSSFHPREEYFCRSHVNYSPR